MIMICQCRFIDCNKWTTLVGNANNGEAMHLWGDGVYGKSLYIPLNFAVNQKLLIKKVLEKERN